MEGANKRGELKTFFQVFYVFEEEKKSFGNLKKKKKKKELALF